ncbi:MAG TPA: adenosylcobinamide-GDP ribazoletransferase [Prolixibacteraceae bacterium]|nr:adenosylcobinamide-GDP ribazoletransferase [Prolixibacteraceae bacterium]
MFRKQLHLFLTALMFYTRIPVRMKNCSDDDLNRSTRYFPLVGLLVGAVGALVVWGATRVLPLPIGVILSLAATILLTGAFHEDGFADFCDGFGGGYTREKILSIMKDSRIGTFGAAGLILMLLLKIFTLSSVNPEQILWLIVAAHGLSRVMPVVVIFTSSYVRDDESSRMKPVGKKGTPSDFILAVFWGLLPLLFAPVAFTIAIVPVLLIAAALFRLYIVRKIGGYTGDCLGALQQISEVIIFLGFLVFERL